MTGVSPNDGNRYVQTVLGQLPAASLGVTLMHEHLLVTTVNPTFREPDEASGRRRAYESVGLQNRGWIEFNWANNRDNLILDDEELAISEAGLYYRAGGDTIVDVTPVGIGRDPRGLARISRASGLNIVMGSGYYVAPTHPASLANAAEDRIAEEIVRDFRYGVADTGVKAGVIGEIGCSWPLADSERKVLRAAAKAQSDLKCGLSIHPGRDPRAPGEILDILRRNGADVSRVIIGHIERTVQDTPGIKSLMDSGCFVEWDIFGIESTAHYPYRAFGIDIPSDAQRLNQIAELVSAGYSNRVLISHDICFKHRLARYGGQGYAHIPLNVIPWMKQRRFDDATINQIIVGNPRRALELHGKSTTS